MQYSKAIILQFKIKKLKKAIVKLLVFYYFLKRHCWMSLSYDRRFHWSCILDYSSFYKENKPKDQNLMSIDSCCLVAESCSTLLRPDGLEPTRLFCPWDFPDKNTGVGFHFLQTDLGDMVGSIPDHCNKAKTAVNQAPQIFSVSQYIRKLFTLYCGPQCVQ